MSGNPAHDPPDGAIIRLTQIDATLGDHDWAFAREQRDAIAAFWTTRQAGAPAMFDGRVLLQSEGHLEGGIFRAKYFETSYSSFLAWLQMGVPGRLPRNGFAMAALRASDGAFLLGQMGQNTANAGKVYFAAGTPDLGDVTADGKVDLAGSVTRELMEETGLRLDEVSVGTGWTAVFAQKRVAFMRGVAIDMPADAARLLMLDRMKTLHEEELSDIVIIRSMADCAPHNMPSFMLDYLAYVFEGESRS
jgi:8-oxo-dGTP pyrophosphatase MutT (NUDIX family)